MKQYICFETGGTNIRFAIVNEALEVSRFKKIPTARFNASMNPFDLICEQIDGMIDEVGKENVAAIACSWAAMLDLSRRVLLTAPNVKGFDGCPIVDRLEERYGLPTALIRDCNSLLLYEIYRQKLEPKGVICCAFLGTGLGNAISFNGELYHGANGACAELGHIPVRGVTGTCVCGKQGCVEVLCSGKVLHTLAEEKYKVPIETIFEKHLGEEDVWNVVKYSAIAIATEITLLDPSYMIIGGGVTRIPGFPFERFEEEIRNNLRLPNPRLTVRLLRATGDDEAGVVGAAINAMHELGKSR